MACTVEFVSLDAKKSFSFVVRVHILATLLDKTSLFKSNNSMPESLHLNSLFQHTIKLSSDLIIRYQAQGHLSELILNTY